MKSYDFLFKKRKKKSEFIQTYMAGKDVQKEIE